MQWISSFLFPYTTFNKQKLNKILYGKTILITGATYGIGEQIAYLFAQQGVTLILTARTQEKLTFLQQQLQQQGAKVYTFTADLYDDKQTNDLITFLNSFSIDIFISNAGKSICRSIYDSLDRFYDYQRTMSINYFAPVKINLSLIAQNRALHIIQISSMSILFAATPYWSAYHASKKAFDEFIHSIAPELNNQGVYISSVYFPLVNTRMILPNKAYQNMPTMSSKQAAYIVAKLLINRKKIWRPWWTFFVRIFSFTCRRYWEKMIIHKMKINRYV